MGDVDVCIISSNPPSHPWGLARLGTFLARGFEDVGVRVQLIYPPTSKFGRKILRYTYLYFLRPPKAKVYIISAHILAHFSILLPSNTTYVWVADFIPLRWGTTSQKIGLQIEMLFMKRGYVVGISKYTADIARRYIGDHVVGYVYPSISPVFYPRSKAEVKRIREKYELPEEYILHVGNTKPHKNIGALVEAAALIDLPLVKVGGSRRYVEHLAEKCGANVIYVPYVPDEELAAIYSGASVYVQPSWDEGFGYPVVEAAACGTPVIVSDRASLPEVGRLVNGLVVDPDPEAIAESISTISRKKDLKNAGRVRALFSPSNSAKAFIDLLERTGVYLGNVS